MTSEPEAVGVPPRRGYGTLDEAAASCRLSNRYVWGLVNAGTLPASRVGRKLLLSFDDLDAFLRSRKAGPRPEAASA